MLVTARARDPLLPAMMLTGMRWSSLVEQALEFHAIPYEKPLEAGDAVRFAESAKQMQENASARLHGMVNELAERHRLSPDETSVVLASITGPAGEGPQSPRAQGGSKTMAAHILSKTGAKSLRDLRDSLLRSYFGESI